MKVLPGKHYIEIMQIVIQRSHFTLYRGVVNLLHWENYISISFQIEWDMIVVTVYHSILNQMELHLVQNRKENCHHDHIPYNVKGNGNIVFSVCRHHCPPPLTPQFQRAVIFRGPELGPPDARRRQPLGRLHACSM